MAESGAARPAPPLLPLAEVSPPRSEPSSLAEAPSALLPGGAAPVPWAEAVERRSRRCRAAVGPRGVCLGEPLPRRIPRKHGDPQQGSPATQEAPPRHSPVPVNTFTFCVLPWARATCFSTSPMSSQASASP
uniref:Uncharacterized protein n=1 Tax=Amazona collaria TaxID=241587 RepID=A0A8B9J1R4_9PSIT